MVDACLFLVKYCDGTAERVWPRWRRSMWHVGATTASAFPDASQLLSSGLEHSLKRARMAVIRLVRRVRSILQSPFQTGRAVSIQERQMCSRMNRAQYSNDTSTWIPTVGDVDPPEFLRFSVVVVQATSEYAWCATSDGCRASWTDSTRATQFLAVTELVGLAYRSQRTRMQRR